MPDPLMGFTLQSFAPLVQPFAVSGVLALLSLDHPSVLPEDSPVVASAETPRRIREAPMWRGLRDDPRLQGFAPHESPPPGAGGLGRRQARGSPGFRPLQGVPPRWIGPALTAPPLMGLVETAASGRNDAPPGSHLQRDWLAPLRAADPPGVCTPFAVTVVREGRDSGVSSSGPGVRHRPLTAIFESSSLLCRSQP
jgi:hypothetical protein